MSTSPRSISSLGLTVMLSALMLLCSVLLPSAVQAQPVCPLPARLQVGDGVEVIDGVANNLRSGPGLAYARLRQRMVPGDVWYVQAGPICADGIHWYQVAAYDFAAWTAEGQPGRGYYLGRTDRLPNHGGSSAVCASERLSVGMRAMVGDQRRQHVRQAANKNAAHSAWLYPGVPVTILDGPRCADGWIWWYIRDDSGRIQGWTSEGDGPARPWLVPTWGR